MGLKSEVSNYLLRCERARQPAHASELAYELGVSRQTLHQRFMTEFGMPPGAYLRRSQMLRSVALLGRITVQDAAERAGYSCEKSFRRAYKTIFGMSLRKL